MAFQHLCGIHTLDMQFCNQATMTDAAFVVHLRRIQTLYMNYCTQATIMGAVFVHLHGIQSLDNKPLFLGRLDVTAPGPLTVNSLASRARRQPRRCSFLIPLTDGLSSAVPSTDPSLAAGRARHHRTTAAVPSRLFDFDLSTLSVRAARHYRITAVPS